MDRASGVAEGEAVLRRTAAQGHRSAPPPAPVRDPRLHVPSLPPRLVSRPRLLEQLNAASDAGALTLVTAGPGGGKTVLLSEWATGRTPPVAWLALTRADDDPGRFWRLFLAAARVSGPLPSSSAWSAGAVPAVLDAILSAEPDGTPAVVVVLDDAHVLTDPSVVDGLDRVVRRWSHRVRLVLATRSVPLLPIHQYRLGGQLHELRAADLAMTPEEVAQLLAAHDVVLSGRETELLTRRTEGWTAGLRLAALRMEGVARPADFVADLAMDGGSIGEYLIEEVLSVLPAEVRHLLVATSFLDVVSGGVAEAVTGIEGCEQVLTDLARTNSFVVPVDPSCTSFRYHQLFREVLRYLARRQSPAATREAHRRAAGWFAERADVRSALQVALEGGDPALGRSLLLHGGLARAFVGGQDLATLRLGDLVEDPPADASAELHAELALTRVVVGALQGTCDVEAAAAADDETDALLVTRRLAELLLADAAGAFDAVDQAAARLLTDARAGVEQVRGLASALLLVQARARSAAGRPEEMGPLLRAAAARAEQEHAVEVQLQVLAVQALVEALAARPHRSDEAMARALDLLGDHPAVEAPVVLELAVALRAYREADVAAMSSAMQRVLARGAPRGDREVEGLTALLQGLLCTAGGDLVRAGDWLRTPALRHSRVDLLSVHRDCALARLELGSGRAQQARVLLEPWERTPYAVFVAVPMANALLAAGDATGAERRLQAVLAHPGPQVDRAMLVAALLCRGAVALHRSQEAQALEALEQARELAGSEVVMPFTSAAGVFAPLLRRHPGVAATWPAPVALSAVAALPGPRTPAHLSDPLTDRETAVLRLLTSTMSTSDLADHMYLSVNTVKTHLSAVYRKLGVSRRREAVDRARELELL